MSKNTAAPPHEQQAPMHSGFSATSTAREVMGARRLDGKIAIVTGGYAGIGLETTRVLAAAGATVIVPARTLDKAQTAIASIEHARGGGGGDGDRERGVEIEELDLANPKSIDAFAERFLASKRPLHLLINNAGIMAVPYERDSRGFENHFATNHLGHFQLAVRLWPALVKADGGARLISLSSRGHVRSGVDFEDPNFERRPYDKWIAYGQSKSANVLFAVAADERGQKQGIRAFAVHPGGIITDLMRSMPKDEQDEAIERAKKIGMLKTIEQGAATTIWCATSEQLNGKGGVYCEDVDIAKLLPADTTESNGVRPWAIDRALADRLWKKSEEWTGAKLA